MSTRTSKQWVDASVLYGPEWQETKRRYFASPYTRKRCFWCRRSPADRKRHELHHLTYRRKARPFFWQVKPMCSTCHGIETTVSRVLKVLLRRRRVPHVTATYGVRWLINLAVLSPIWYPLVFVFHVIP